MINEIAGFDIARIERLIMNSAQRLLEGLYLDVQGADSI